jgi:hypothetical protein
MSLERSNPIAISTLSAPVGEPLVEQQWAKLIERIRDTDKSNQGWLEGQLEVIQQRYGPLPERDLPWENASNLNVPMSDGILRRWRPGIASLVLDASPVAFFHSIDSDDNDAANDARIFFEWMFLEQIEAPIEVVRLADLIGMHGHAYAREGWNYETERYVRVVRANELFPGGVQNAIEQLKQQVAQQGGDPETVDPLEVVMGVLAEEYGLNPELPEEGLQLEQAAIGLLQGQPYVRIEYITVEKDQPSWSALSPINVITENVDVPERDSEFFVVLHEVTLDKVMRMARDGIFEGEAAAELVRLAQSANADGQGKTEFSNSDGTAEGTRERIRQLLDNRTGTNSMATGRRQTPTVWLWEIFAKIDLDGDFITERTIAWYAPDFNIRLALANSPYPFREHPVTSYKFEPYAQTIYDSRGIFELLFELQELNNAQTNMRLDAGQLMLAPAFQYRMTGMDPQNLRLRPGALIPVQAVGDIAPIAHDLRILTALLQEQQLTQRVAETFIGTFDATLNQLSRPTERRTAQEVQAIQSLAANVFGLDARVFQIYMARSFKKLWNLYIEFGSEETYFRIKNEPRRRLAKKREIGRKFDIVPAGNPSNTNPALMIANVERAMQVILSAQTDAVDSGELIGFWLSLLDPKLADRVVRDPNQREQARIVAAAAQIAQDGGGL